MSIPQTIDVHEAYEEIEHSDALLVCAYDDQAKFEQNRLEHAISMATLRSEEAGIARNRELIFY